MIIIELSAYDLMRGEEKLLWYEFDDVELLGKQPDGLKKVCTGDPAAMVGLRFCDEKVGAIFGSTVPTEFYTNSYIILPSR